MAELQKECYKKILMKEAITETRTKTSLMNTLMQLRKCSNHPYLFDGVSPAWCHHPSDFTASSRLSCQLPCTPCLCSPETRPENNHTDRV